MPEIKNTFSQGKMNKDLDERFVPNGQYRDALNIDITSSEDGSAGTAQNIPGNLPVEYLVSSNCVCVGSIANERTNKLYWFIKGENRDAILEYDQNTGSTQFIAVDLAGTSEYQGLISFLNFTGSQITGINIVDDFLFWTDGINEPKKINISKSSQANPALTFQNQDHAYLYIDGVQGVHLEEKHVTVIKRKPSVAPTVKTINAKGDAGEAIFEKVLPRFCFRYKYKDGEYSAFGPFTEVIFNPQYDNLVNASNSYIPDEPYNKSMVNLIKSIELYDFVPSDIPEDVVQVDILYKQENSPVIYSVANIKYTDSEWSENGSAQFTEGVETSHKGKYVISNETIQAALPENQFLRAFDNVPKAALAQEIVGNRLVYANYKQGYDFVESIPGIDGGYQRRPNQDFTKGGLKHIKSLREYQLGYVVGDKYGRETPVISSNDAGLKVRWSTGVYGLAASNSFMLNARLTSALPEWAEYYKFYVKSDSAEYYNLVMDKSYFPHTHSEFENTQDHFYISFPSSDRNKLTEDDYIIAKKIYDGSNTQVAQENKYKILDISNNAPSAVKYVFYSLGQVDNNSGGLNGDSGLFYTDSGDTENLRIDRETTLIAIRRDVWLDEFGAFLLKTDGGDDVELQGSYAQNMYVSWQLGDQHSDRYKVSDVRTGSYENFALRLEKQISNKDARLASVNGVITPEATNVALNLIFKIEKRELRSEEDFSGKFFVKIQHNNYLTTLDQSDQFYLSADAQSAYLRNTHTPGTFDETSSIINSDSETIPNTISATPEGTISDEEGDWSTLVSSGVQFFIDDAYFISSNPSQFSYAKESGEGWCGARTEYRPIEWVGDSFEEGVDEDNEPIVYSGWEYSTRVSLSPTPQWPAGDSGKENLINSVEGIVETTDVHTSGARRWVNDTIYGSRSSIEYDATYTEEDGKFFMHLSFLAPGDDLHDGFEDTTLEGVYLKGPDSIASKMQGIWGGGVFTLSALVQPTASTTNVSSLTTSNFGQSQLKYVEFEGNYDAEGNALEEAPGWNGVNSIGEGYDSEYAKKHVEQWNPAYSENGIDNEIQAFVSKLTTAGSKFRFKRDVDETVYTIKSVQEKHLYNHTSWRTRVLYDGTGYIFADNSVEEAASAWANAANAGGEPTDASLAEALCGKIVDFGQANNRRVCYVIELDKNPETHYDPRGDYDATLSSTDLIEFLSDIPPALSGDLFSAPTIWETEPGQLADLNIYFEASGNIPTRIEGENREIFAPIGSSVSLSDLPSGLVVELPLDTNGDTQELKLVNWVGNNTLKLEPGLPATDVIGDAADYTGAILKFTRADGSYTQAKIFDNDPVNNEGLDLKQFFNVQIEVDTTLDVGLNWFNCFCFGDGIESDRVRDGFNEMRISSGARASATVEEPILEEHRTNGLIYSGIYNSNSKVNNLNQFIAGEKITKDVNPTYGSIQKLFTRNADLVTLCEDKVLKILANKDALFNADGNPQLVATERVLGQSIPFAGDYGISTHPESFAADSFRAYFADRQRGAVLRLSKDGLTPISDAGMRDWFRDNLVNNAQLLGSFDAYSKHYNLTIRPKVFTTPIINDTISEGEVVQEFTNNTNKVTDGALNSGFPFQGENTINELVNQNVINQNYLPGEVAEVTELDSSVLISQNEALDSSTTIQSFPAISFNEYQSAGVIEGETIEGEYNPIFGSGTGFSMYFDADDLTATINDPNAANCFDSDDGIGSSQGAKFYIDRYSNHNNPTGSQSGGSSASIQTTGSNYDEINEPIPQNNFDSSYWPYNTPVQVFMSDGTYSVPDDLSINLPSFGDNNYAVDTLNKGIVFRGLARGTNNEWLEGYTPMGYLMIPAAGGDGGFASNHLEASRSKITENVLDNFPNAKNNTIFNNEEIEVRVHYRVNHYSDSASRRAQVTLALMDGNDPLENILDDSLLVGGVGAGNTPALTYQSQSKQVLQGSASLPIAHVNAYGNGDGVWNGNLWYYDPEDVGYPDAEGYIHNKDKTAVRYFKIKNSSLNDGDVVVQNLKFRIGAHFENGNGTYDSHLDRAPEVVITGFSFRKIYALQQYTDSDTIIPDQPIDDVPGYDIPAWTKVSHTAPEGVNAWEWNLNYGNELLYGIENLPTATNSEELADGTIVEWQEGQNPVDPFGNELADLPDDGEYPVTFNSSIIKLQNSVNHHNKSLSTNVKANHWYLVDMYMVDEQGQDIDDESLLSNLNIQIYGVAPNNSSTNSIEAFLGGIGQSIPTAEGSATRNLKLKPIFKDDYAGGSQFVLRGLFYTGEDIAEGIIGTDILQLRNSGNAPAYCKRLKIFDVTDEDFAGGTFTHWDLIDENSIIIERAFVSGSDEEYSYPRAYYKNNRLNIYKSTKGIKQFISSFYPTNDGFKLNFTVSPNTDADQFVDGAKVVVARGGSNGFKLDYAASQVGDYEVLFNIVEGNVGQVFLNSELIDIAMVEEYSGQAKIEFRGSTSESICSVDNISLVDVTNYFSTTGAEGEGVNAWTINGFDQTVENFIAWNEGQIQFTEAPSLINQSQPDGAVFISQDIGALQPNTTFDLSFDVELESGALQVSYYTVIQGITYGFSSIVNSANNGFFNASLIIEEIELDQSYNIPINSLVIKAHGTIDTTTGAVDNIFLVRTILPQNLGAEIQTVTYNEDVQGWVSFKSFVPENGLSLSNQYFTMDRGRLYQHYINNNRNTFYGQSYPSTLTCILNAEPSTVKNFKTLAYEGSQANVSGISLYNDAPETEIQSYPQSLSLHPNHGWRVSNIYTDIESGSINEFINKENKWFNYIKGNQIFGSSNVDTSSLNVQGVGIIAGTQFE